MVSADPVEGDGFQVPGKPSGDAVGVGLGLCVHSACHVSSGRRPHAGWVGRGTGGWQGAEKAINRWNSDFSYNDPIRLDSNMCTGARA